LVFVLFERSHQKFLPDRAWACRLMATIARKAGVM